MRNSTILTSFLFTILLCSGCVCSRGAREIDEIDSYERIPFPLIIQIGTCLAENYNLNLILGGGLFDDDNDKASKIVLFFGLERALDQKEARHLILDVAQSLLYNINHNEFLRPYLDHYPFEPKDIGLVFSIQIQMNDMPPNPEPCVSLDCGKIKYYNVERGTDCFNKTELTETYEEALEIAGACKMNID